MARNKNCSKFWKEIKICKTSSILTERWDSSSIFSVEQVTNLAIASAIDSRAVRNTLCCTSRDEFSFEQTTGIICAIKLPQASTSVLEFSLCCCSSKGSESILSIVSTDCANKRTCLIYLDVFKDTVLLKQIRNNCKTNCLSSFCIKAAVVWLSLIGFSAFSPSSSPLTSTNLTLCSSKFGLATYISLISSITCSK
ncbi:hypothetical protein FF38_09314 [Lucilia cuprina]|uniref:Uncharacterized protein n=1 Tax=Lucilia cuprina TaxID=7375 RepID=A0A0L0CF87_LUCCU|nr:hypothetical protein FF38_09314 [Lucilia cuprina]